MIALQNARKASAALVGRLGQSALQEAGFIETTRLPAPLPASPKSMSTTVTRTAFAARAPSNGSVWTKLGAEYRGFVTATELGNVVPLSRENSTLSTASPGRSVAFEQTIDDVQSQPLGIARVFDARVFPTNWPSASSSSSRLGPLPYSASHKQCLIETSSALT